MYWYYLVLDNIDTCVRVLRGGTVVGHTNILLLYYVIDVGTYANIYKVQQASGSTRVY